MISSRSATIKPPVAAIIGFSLMLLGTGVFSYELGLQPVPTPEGAVYLGQLAVGYLLTFFGGIALVIFNLRKVVRQRVDAIRNEGVAPISSGWLVPYVLSLRRYRRYFAISAILYGLLYAFITNMIVYQPGVDFAGAYGASIPSLAVTPVFGTPLLTPVVTIYLTDHLGILLVPLTILLAIAVSILVGLNFAIVGFALDNRAKGGGKGWVSGLGAVVGLFTGCPTCAGLLFSNVLGGTGAVSFATLLGYYQPGFILLSLPALFVAPYLTSRSLSKVFREGCIYLDRTSSQGKTAPTFPR